MAEGEPANFVPNQKGFLKRARDNSPIFKTGQSQTRWFSKAFRKFKSFSR
jgi:hypothetical protein